MGSFYYTQRLVAHIHFPWLAVQFEKERSCPIRMWLACRHIFNDERLARFYRNGDFFLRLQAVKKRRRGQNTHVAVGWLEFLEVQEKIRVTAVSEEVFIRSRLPGLVLQLLFFRSEIGCGHAGAGPRFYHVCAWQQNSQHDSRPAHARNTERPGKHFNNGI